MTNYYLPLYINLKIYLSAINQSFLLIIWELESKEKTIKVNIDIKNTTVLKCLH